MSTWRLAGRAEQGRKALDWILTAEPALGSVSDNILPCNESYRDSFGESLETLSAVELQSVSF